jgi:glycerophosphoryl diester phosphodiesterase
MANVFELQGHRGARGLKPENTLPGFEVALDFGVTSIETDVHLTGDDIPVLIHDPAVNERLCRRLPGCPAPEPAGHPLVRSLTLLQVRGYAADINPDPRRFPGQDAGVTSLAELFASAHAIHPMSPPALTDLFAFAAAYAGGLGREAGKSQEQQTRASEVRFDLELKRAPFHPEVIGDGFDGTAPGLLEQQVVEAVSAYGMTARTTVRSFDHRSILAVRQLEPELISAVLISGAALIAPGDLVRQAGAQVYCPDHEFLDEAQVRQAHGRGIRVLPWTVNRPEDWERLRAWEVDGMTTDYPDRLGEWLRRHGIVY